MISTRSACRSGHRQLRQPTQCRRSRCRRSTRSTRPARRIRRQTASRFAAARPRRTPRRGSSGQARIPLPLPRHLRRRQQRNYAGETTTIPAINVAVADRKLQLEVSGASLNWDVLRSVRVDLATDRPPPRRRCRKLRAQRRRRSQVGRQFNGAIRGTSPHAHLLSVGRQGRHRSAAGPRRDQHAVPRSAPAVGVLNVGLLPSGTG